MNMPTKNLLLVTTVSLVQVACGGGGGGSSTSASIEAALDGVWRSDCAFNIDDADYQQDTLNIDQTEFTLTQSTFNDQSCTQKEQDTVIAGSFDEGDVVTTTDQSMAREIDLTLSDVAISLVTEPAVISANNMSLCGVTSWRVGVSIDVSSCPEISGTTVPTQRYDIYRVDGNALYLGDEASMLSADRPTTLDTEAVYQRLLDDQSSAAGNDHSNTGSDVLLPENSLALDANNVVSVSQFAIYNYELVQGLTNAGNTGVLSGAGNSSGRTAGLYITSMCEGGGQVSLNGTPALLANLTATYTDCAIDDRVFSGQMSLVFMTANGNLGDTASNWSFSAAANVDGLKVSSIERDLEFEGDFILSTVFTADTEISGGATSRFQGIDDETIYIHEEGQISRMTDFDFLFSYRNEIPAVYSDVIDEARIASSVIGGQVSMFQSSPYSGFGINNPVSGLLEILGADLTRIEIDAEDSEMVIISVDSDGNADFSDNTDRVLIGSWTDYF